jgi:type I restriction enzyme S subunit
MTCIVDGKIDLTKAGEVEEVDKSLLLRKGDLLFNRTNSLDQVAKVGLLDIEPDAPTSFASYLVRIRTNERTSGEYLVYLLNSSIFLEFARKNAIPAIGQANLNPTRYGEICIPLPPRKEQDEIITAIIREREQRAEMEAALNKSIELLKERRSALITAAVTGQIEPEAMKL